ncbi:MAG: 16S rRNA (uracil(1498)-N(3))-methyltransferase [Defluviitaleaceae bacterium]|nr:16S rRNA (uracil(1498)-N(3))-methyltransferase [Defluviitaleaceae bacterium]
MPKYFVDLDKFDERPGQVLQLDKRDPVYHHLTQVLRVRVGDKIIICDGHCIDYHCHVETLTPLVLSIESYRECRTELPFKITLYQAMPKADKMEWIVQKAVELGVHAIVPVYTTHCVVRLSKSNGTKTARYQKIAESAAGQSMRGIIPVVHEPVGWDNLIKTLPDNQFMITAYEKADPQHTLMTAVKSIKDAQDIGLWIGPEGGFSLKEAEAMEAAEFNLVSLGVRILRTETAAIATLAQIVVLL